MKFNESKKFISLLDGIRQFLEDSLQLSPTPSQEVKKLLKTYNEVINAAERANNENQWTKFLEQYADEIQAILEFAHMITATTNVKKSKNILRMKDSLKKTNISE